MNIRVFLLSYDSGYYRQRMGLGPERIYESGLKPLFERTGIHFEAEEIHLESSFTAEIAAAFELYRKLSPRVHACLEAGAFPIVLSGNCSAAIGTVSGCGASETGVVWFDAHGETTTPETTTSGFLDGMGISTLTGQCWKNLARSIPGYASVPGDRIFLFGSRDVEPAEDELLKALGVHRPGSVTDFGNGLGAAAGVEQIYLHFDFDVLDPLVATGNQWTPPGGISVEDLTGAISEAQMHKKIAALGIASYNPAVDVNGNALAAAMTATELILSHLNNTKPLG